MNARYRGILVQQMDFSCVVAIPARNEERSIQAVVHGCNKYGFPVLVVDDGSEDKTAFLASSAGAFVITNRFRTGVGAALQQAFLYARARGAKTVITLDGDGAHLPEDIDSLLATHIGAAADLTIGSRFMPPEEGRSLPSPKQAANLFARSILNSLLGTRLTDVASGMRALSERCLGLELQDHTYGFLYEQIVKATFERLKIAESPISVKYDANDLFCTNRRELVDFLQSCIKAADLFSWPPNRLLTALECVRAGTKLRVEIDSTRFIVSFR